MEGLGVPASPVPDDAAWLLDLIAGERLVTFQTFDDAKRGRTGLTRVLHGNLAKPKATLAALNEKGAGVYFMVNGGDGKGRRASNVREVRALFADLDGAPLLPVQVFEPAPHAIVESSPGRFHAYWLVTGVPVDEFKGLQSAIAAKFAGDPKVTDAPRVMRLPGFLHLKGEPFRARIVHAHRHARYSAATMRKAFAPPIASAKRPERQTLPERIAEGGRNAQLFDLARGLVNKGHDLKGTNSRIQRINAERCDPPLCATEVDAIVASAFAHGSTGYASIPHAVLDSPKWKRLPHPARSIVVAAYRRFNGSNDGNISLPYEDFEGEFGRGQFYRARSKAVTAGFLAVAHKSRYSKRGGKEPDLFGLSVKRDTNGVVKTGTLNSFQALGVEDAIEVTGPKANPKPNRNPSVSADDAP